MKFLFLIFLLCLPVNAVGLLPNQDSAKISEISLEMIQGSLGIGKPLGRAFTISLRRDGTALFECKANVKLIGKYRGKISENAFAQLADFLISRNYLKIKDELPHRISAPAGEVRMTMYDSPVVITTIVSDGKEKVIRRLTIVTSEYKKSIPREITEIENAISETATKIKWEKSDN